MLKLKQPIFNKIVVKRLCHLPYRSVVPIQMQDVGTTTPVSYREWANNPGICTQIRPHQGPRTEVELLV